MDETTRTLRLVSNARNALIEAKTLPDIRRVMEAASVATDAGRRAAKLAEASGLATDVVRETNDAANAAAAVRIEAQAKAGEILQLMAEQGERASRGRQDQMSQRATFSDLKVSRSESSRWQTVASIPEPIREEYVETVKAQGAEVTTAGLVRFDLERRMEEQDKAIETLFKGDREIEDARYRNALSRAMRHFRNDQLPLASGPVTRVYDRTELDELLDDIREMRLWCDRMESAIRNPCFEVIDGDLRKAPGR